ncbi:MAG: hypothetical protein WBY94_14285 [Polyangiaceae bacterium]
MRFAVAAVEAILLAGCSSNLPRPPFAPQPQSALEEVSSSLPPGRVESVPDRPTRSAVWLDGEWVWRRTRWSWLPGRWVEAPSGARFSPWAFVRGADGRLWYAAGVWRDRAGSPIDAPPPLAAAQVGSAPVVNASGDAENTGPTLPASSPARSR